MVISKTFGAFKINWFYSPDQFYFLEAIKNETIGAIFEIGKPFFRTETHWHGRSAVIHTKAFNYLITNPLIFRPSRDCNIPNA